VRQLVNKDFESIKMQGTTVKKMKSNTNYFIIYYIVVSFKFWFKVSWRWRKFRRNVYEQCRNTFLCIQCAVVGVMNEYCLKVRVGILSHNLPWRWIKFFPHTPETFVSTYHTTRCHRLMPWKGCTRTYYIHLRAWFEVIKIISDKRFLQQLLWNRTA
jgi:hypothetical protein